MRHPDPLSLLPRCKAKKQLRRKRARQRRLLVLVAGTHQRERRAGCFLPRWGEDLHINDGVRVPRSLRRFVEQYEADRKRALDRILEDFRQRRTP